MTSTQGGSRKIISAVIGLAPIIHTLRTYRRDSLAPDLSAGLIVGIITIPQAVAYAMLAGMPPEAGLYACLVPLLLYAVFGTSPHLMVGPVAMTALLVASAIGTFSGPGETPASIAGVLCIEAGAMLWLMRAARMSGLVNLLSHPVMSGFVSAAAVLIILSQLQPLIGSPLGISRPSDLLDLLDMLTHANGSAVLIGISSLAFLISLQRLGPAFLRRFGLGLTAGQWLARTGPLAVTIVGTVCVTIFDLHRSAGVAVVGDVPAGLPDFALPSLNPELWRGLLPSSALIAIIAYVESYSIATALAARKGSRIEAAQELIALGAANIGAGLTGAYPVAGSFSRSGVAFQSDARTTVSGLFCAAVIMLALAFLTPWIADVPMAALAAIIIFSVFGIIDLKGIRQHWRGHRADSLTQLVTFSAVVAVSVEAGLVTGIALSIAFFLRQSSRARMTVVGRVEGTGQVRDVDRYDIAPSTRVLALRIDEDVFFANAGPIEALVLERLSRQPSYRHLLLVGSSINRIDTTGAEMIARLSRNLAVAGVKVHLSDIKGTVLQQLESAGVTHELTGQIFFSAEQGLHALA
ncbi:MAG: SulP family inorganic anion transporter [Pseudomonadales bacterium]